MRRVILNADDLGLCSTINRSVNRCFQDGILTSTSLMTPAPFAKDALLLASQSNWNDKIGLHLTFTAEWPTYKWKPLSNNINLMEGNVFPTEALIFCNYSGPLLDPNDFFVKNRENINSVFPQFTPCWWITNG